MPHSRDPLSYPDEYMYLLTAIREAKPRELIVLPECARREAYNFRLRFGAFINACKRVPPLATGERPQYAADAEMFSSRYQLKVQPCSVDTALVLMQLRSSLPDAIAVAEVTRKLRESMKGSQAVEPITQVIPIHTPRSSVQSEPTDYDNLIASMYGSRASAEPEPDGTPPDASEKK